MPKQRSHGSKSRRLQSLIRHYKEETGEREVDLKAVAAWALARGYPKPKPLSDVERVAKDFAAAAREETRDDPETGQSYRVNHMYIVDRGGEQLHLWVDIDEAPRAPMHMSLRMRREQIVGDVTQLTFDAEHWNRVNPSEAPIEIEKDFGLDVEIRRNTPEG